MDSSNSSLARTFDSERRNSRGYTDITIRDSARAHLGDSIHHGDIIYVTCKQFYGSVLEQPNSESPAASASRIKRSRAKRKRSTNDSDEPNHQRRQHELEAALSRLEKFSKSIKDEKFGKDAQKVARHFRALLDALRDDPSSTEHAQEEWDALKECVVGIDRVGINVKSPQVARTNVVKVDRKKDVIRFGQWQISLTTRIYNSRDAIGNEASETCTTLRVEPSTRFVGPSIAVFVDARTDFMNRNFLDATIFAYRTVKSGSKVFKLVEEDDIDGLVKLLAVQGATTRDCDEENRSLLFYACHYRSPRCCKLLVEEGADLDRYGRSLGMTRYHKVEASNALLTPLHSVGDLDYEGEENCKSKARVCVEILLDAGADPTIAGVSAESPLNAWLTTFKYPFLDAFDMLLDSGKMYIDAESTRSRGKTLWLHACEEPPRLREPAKTLERLLSMDFSVTETSDPEGWNCLFFFVLKAIRPDRSNEAEAIQFLLTRFTDINARDASGRAITDYLDDDKKEIDDINKEVQDDHESYQRDLWYYALERTGMLCKLENIQALRSQKPRFTEVYTPLHFYALRYLDHWHVGNLWSQVKAVLQKHPWSEEERNEMARLFCEKGKILDWSDSMSEEAINDIGQYLGVDSEPRLSARRAYWRRRASIHNSDEESDADSKDDDWSSDEWRSSSNGEVREDFPDQGQDSESEGSEDQMGGRMISHDTEMGDWQDTEGARA